MKLWKLQKFFGDVVYDLRQRGLLPIVVLLLVGMVAVPLLITGGGSKSSATESMVTQAAELAPENQKAVVAYQPGVRDYKERLKNLTAKDPFKQQFIQAAAAASQLSTSVDASTTTTDTGTAGTDTTTSDTGSEGTGEVGGKVPGTGGSGKGGGGSTKTKTRYVYYTTDLEVGDIGVEPQRRNGVRALTPLPSDMVPVAIYLGATLNGKRALFMLSDAVTQVSDTNQCLPSPQECSMLALEAGESEDLFYSSDGRIYRIKVLRNRRVISSKPPS